MQQNKVYYRTNTAKRRKHRNRRRYKYLIVIIAIFAVVFSISALIMKTQSVAVANGETTDEQVSDSQAEQTVSQTIQNTEIENNNAENPTIESGYDYSKPVPESNMAENSYFDDAVFIGDSRTEGLILYTGLSNAISYANKGLMVDTVFTKPVINKNGEKLSVMDALRQTNFSKVYIMLGINETGWPYNSVFIEKYGKIIDEIKTINPEAVIYVQEILPVTDKVSQTHSYIKNGKINEYNELILQMAEEKGIYYIDTGKAVADANDSLPEDAAIDGIHLKQPYCEKWLNYLKTHIVTE